MRLSADQRSILANAMCYSLYIGLGFSFMTPFALALGANNTYIGILSAMPFLAMILSQYPAQMLISRWNRRVVYLCLTVPSRFGIPFAGLSPLIFGPLALPMILVFILYSYLLDTMSEPAWLSIIAEKVAITVRGQFFSLRMLVENVGVSLAMIVGGFYLDLFDKGSLVGFCTLFFAALIFGFLASYNFQKVKPKPYHDHHNHSLKEFFTFKGKFARFLLFAFAFSFAAMIAGPFFNVYMLENLKMSYSFFVLATATATIGRLTAMVHLGRLADVVGDKKVTVISAVGTALSPSLFMMIGPEQSWLVFPVQFLIGVVWAGIETSTLNMLLDLTKERERGLRAAQFYMVNSIPMVIAPIIGGLIADHVTLFAISGIPLVFFISSWLRAFSPVLLAHLSEPRVKNSVTYTETLKRFFIWHPAHEAKDSLMMIKKVFWHQAR